jgi:hypothetical protein
MTYAADAKFLRDAANHFEHRPTGGEDRAFWANVYNATNCRRIADYVERLPASVTGIGTAETAKQVQGEACQNGPQGDAQTPQSQTVAPLEPPHNTRKG